MRVRRKMRDTRGYNCTQNDSPCMRILHQITKEKLEKEQSIRIILCPWISSCFIRIRTIIIHKRKIYNIKKKKHTPNRVMISGYSFKILFFLSLWRAASPTPMVRRVESWRLKKNVGNLEVSTRLRLNKEERRGNKNYKDKNDRGIWRYKKIVTSNHRHNLNEPPHK